MDGKKNQTDSQIVAQFRIVDDASQEVAAITDTLSAREAFLDDYQNCPLCGAEMMYTHVTHFIDQQVKEEACCTGCNIKVKSNQHSLQ